jgi:hypothetical protein
MSNQRIEVAVEVAGLVTSESWCLVLRPSSDRSSSHACVTLDNNKLE